VDEELLKSIVDECSLVALTRGAKGASIYREGTAFEFGVLSLQRDEVNDLTGAGDTFAAALVTELAKGTELRAAVVSAAFFAALKIRGLVAGVVSTLSPPLRSLHSSRKPTLKEFRASFEQEHTPKISLFDLDGGILA
jgi:sugar/nucleoside kinase (ribokinase family)